MLAVFTGNGKGKTTSCVGHMVRMQGYGKKAVMFQFIKGPWKSGEHFSDLKIIRGGKGFVNILGDKLPFSVHKKYAKKLFKEASKAMRSGKWDLVVLDELNVAVHLKLISVKEVLDILKKIPDDLVVIVSGRHAHPKVVARADLVTEMKEIKHPFKKGILAKRGFDY